MEFTILGPLEIMVAGRRVDLSGDRQRKILAVLLLAGESRTSVDRLVAAVWDAQSPSTARKQVQNCVAALRGRLVGAGAPKTLLETRPSGYQLNIRPEDLDARVFAGHVSTARQCAAANRFEEATEHYRSALRMWRGPVLDDLGSQAVAASAAWLTELQLAASEECFDLELHCGRHERIVGDLVQMCVEFPARERMHGQLMLALHRSGRQVDAFDVYRRLCRHLAEELAVAPGPDILRLHDQLMTCPSARLR